MLNIAILELQNESYRRLQIPVKVLLIDVRPPISFIYIFVYLVISSTSVSKIKLQNVRIKNDISVLPRKSGNRTDAGEASPV